MAEQSDRARSVFISGAQSAHALENQALELLNRQVERIENYPKLKARLTQHIDETNAQIERLDRILSSLNEGRSIVKDNALSLTGNLAAAAHAFMQDEILKNSFANFAFENFEIASYKSLITVAETTGFRDALQPLQQTLKEEQSMAEWLDANLADVTHTYLQRYVAGEKAGL